jgi:superfamily II DNA or RNA helicase
MLGISATVDRKDKLTRILYMFIGNKIYSEERKEEDPVCVRGIEYVTSDSDFMETEHDFRGNVKHSTMITKLCAFGPRSDFIVRVLQDLIKEDSKKQIMILCHNRSLLTYLFAAIEYRKFATTGYYVGGMKQSDLNATEGKQIVLATYAMAAEALDIKTLSTLVMVTPKTDIIQSVGRILRVKHENPIIVDIIDRHECFQNQWRKRKTFYRKCNYRILSTDSVRYKGMVMDNTWKSVYEPKQNSNINTEEEDTPSKCLISIDTLEFIEE